MPRPARPWFRFYSEALESRKVHALGREDPELYYSWSMLMCLANIQRPRGYLPRLMPDIAHSLRENDEKTAEIIGALRGRRFIDVRNKRLYMHDWHEWQPDSDANLTLGRATKNE